MPLIPNTQIIDSHNASDIVVADTRNFYPGTNAETILEDIGSRLDPFIRNFGQPNTAFEFNSTSLAGLTAVGSPSTENADTSRAGHYVVSHSSATFAVCGRYVSTPSAPWTAIAKVSGDSVRANHNRVGMFVGPDGDGPWEAIMCWGGSRQPRAEIWTNPTTAGAAINSPNMYMAHNYWLYIRARSSTEVDMGISIDGYSVYAMNLTFGRNPGLGVVGIAIVDENGNSCKGAFDFLRIWNSSLDCD